jgi:nitronate monooxygenase
MLSAQQIRDAVRLFRENLDHPINLNFFCHKFQPLDLAEAARWKDVLRPHYDHLHLDIDNVPAGKLRMPFDAEFCTVVEEIEPEIVSFHFGLPEPEFVDRLKRRKIKILSSATTLAEAKWLEARGCDAVIAQGSEAGGHRGMFLEDTVATQVGLMSLLPQIVDHVSVPVIAAGGIADARGIIATLTLGASAVQIGTSYLLCPEANVSPLYREALMNPDNDTAITNLYSGRPARGIVTRFVRETGPMSDAAPRFPHAATLVAPLRAASEKLSLVDYMQMWAGQSHALSKPMPAAELTRKLVSETTAAIAK